MNINNWLVETIELPGGWLVMVYDQNENMVGYNYPLPSEEAAHESCQAYLMRKLVEVN